MTRQEPNQLTHEAVAMSSDPAVLMQFSTPRTVEARRKAISYKTQIPALVNVAIGIYALRQRFEKHPGADQCGQ